MGNEGGGLGWFMHCKLDKKKETQRRNLDSRCSCPNNMKVLGQARLLGAIACL